MALWDDLSAVLTPDRIKVRRHVAYHYHSCSFLRGLFRITVIPSNLHITHPSIQICPRGILLRRATCMQHYLLFAVQVDILPLVELKVKVEISSPAAADHIWLMCTCAIPRRYSGIMQMCAGTWAPKHIQRRARTHICSQININIGRLIATLIWLGEKSVKCHLLVLTWKYHNQITAAWEGLKITKAFLLSDYREANNSHISNSQLKWIFV